MKKILVSLMALCMMLSMTTFAATATLSMEADKTTVAPGDTITFTVRVSEEADNKKISAANIVFNYPEDKLEITSSDIAFPDYEYTNTKRVVTAAKGTTSAYVTVQNNFKTGDDTYVSGAHVIATIKAKVKVGATGDITIVGKTATSASVSFVSVDDAGVASKAEKITTMTYPGTITIKSEEKPSFVIPEDSEKTGENNGIVDINTNAETGAYSVKVTAPIGKKAVIYIDGVAQTGSEIAGTATKATTIKVAYEDVEDEVITYVVPMSSIYGAEETGIAAFGKGTIAEGVAYGIKFGGLTGTYKDITDYKFPAKGNVGGIFGVEVKDAPAGDYTAQAYVGDTMGAAISFTK